MKLNSGILIFVINQKWLIVTQNLLILKHNNFKKNGIVVKK